MYERSTGKQKPKPRTRNMRFGDRISEQCSKANLAESAPFYRAPSIGPSDGEEDFFLITINK